MITLDRGRRLLRIAPFLALSACRGEAPPPDGIRPEISALPPAQQAAARAAATRPAVQTGESWNADHIDWQTYEAGMRRAKAEKKPVCLVLYTTWCPHCRNYSHVFDDPRIVERAHDFVMIRADADAEGDLATRYAKDGGYVPRTFFLTSDGAIDEEIHAPRPTFKFFFDERDPGSLLSAMETALRKLTR